MKMREVRTQKEQRFVRATLAETTGWDRLKSWMTCKHSFVWLMQLQCILMQTAIQGWGVNVSHEYALNLCSVTFRDTQRAPLPRPYHNQRVGCLMFRRQRVKRHKEKLGWNNTSAQQNQACSSHTPPRDTDFSNVSLKTLLVLVHRTSSTQVMCTCLADSTISWPHHCLPQWLSTVFPTSSLPPATICEQSVCGRPPGQPQRCSALLHELKMTGPIAVHFVVPVHPSRCSPSHCPFRCTQYIHERLLLIAFIGTFCNPSHFLDVRWHSPPGEDYTFVGIVIWSTGLNSLWVPLSTVFARAVVLICLIWRSVSIITHVTNATSIAIIVCAGNVQNSSSLPLIRASTTFPPFAVAIKPKSRLHWVGLNGSFCNKRGCVGPSRSLVPMSASFSVSFTSLIRTTLYNKHQACSSRRKVTYKSFKLHEYSCHFKLFSKIILQSIRTPICLIWSTPLWIQFLFSIVDKSSDTLPSNHRYINVLPRSEFLFPCISIRLTLWTDESSVETRIVLFKRT